MTAGRCLLAALTALVFVTPALSVEVREQVLQVSYKYKGTDYVFNDTFVPLLPENACYNWYIQTDQMETELAVVEHLRLPEAIDWGTIGDDPAEGIEVKEDGALAESTFTATTDDAGWFTHGWCVAAGDPLGRHKITIAVEGQTLATFDFDVLAADQYTYPAAAASPWAARTANRVW